MNCRHQAPVKAQKLARHSDIRLTAGYAKASREDQADAVRKLPSTINSSQWNSQVPVRPKKSGLSAVDHQIPSRNGHSNPSRESTSASENDPESGTGDDCPQSRQIWRRRESNPQSNSSNVLRASNLEEGPSRQSVNVEHPDGSLCHQLALIDTRLPHLIERWRLSP